MTVDLNDSFFRSRSVYSYKTVFKNKDCSDAVSGWSSAHPEFGISVNPIPTRGADFTHSDLKT